MDTELLIFVTPHIATELRLSEKETEHLERVEEPKTGKKKPAPFEQVAPFFLKSSSGTK